MKLPNVEHLRQPWRIHALVRDFTLEDYWALPMRGGPDDFEDLLTMTRSFDPSQAESDVSRFLWNLRDRLGTLLDLGEVSTPVDGPQTDGLPVPGSGERTLRDRVPRDLRHTAEGFAFTALPFVPLYRTDREAAAEVSNKTIHGVAHLAWVDLGDGRFEGRMAVYVKPRGLLGRAYMAAIKPFRYWIVYPAMMRQMERAWEARPSRPHREAGPAPA